MTEQPAIRVNVTGARQEGSVAVLYGTTDDGAPVLVAADPRMVRDASERLAAGTRTLWLPHLW